MAGSFSLSACRLGPRRLVLAIGILELGPRFRGDIICGGPRLRRNIYKPLPTRACMLSKRRSLFPGRVVSQLAVFPGDPFPTRAGRGIA